MKDEWINKYIIEAEKHANIVEDLQERIKLQDEKIKCQDVIINDTQEKIKRQNVIINDLNKKIIDLQTKIEQRISTRNKSHERLVLGELGRQVEKAICKHILGARTRINSLSVMFNALKSDTVAKNKWTAYMNSIQWNNDLYQTILDLEDLRLNDCHPSTTVDGTPITSLYLKSIANNHINGPDKHLILDDINQILVVLGKLNGTPLFVLDI